jgi:hypothetical protein
LFCYSTAYHIDSWVFRYLGYVTSNGIMVPEWERIWKETVLIH